MTVGLAALEKRLKRFRRDPKQAILGPQPLSISHRRTGKAIGSPELHDHSRSPAVAQVRDGDSRAHRAAKREEKTEKSFDDNTDILTRQRSAVLGERTTQTLRLKLKQLAFDPLAQGNDGMLGARNWPGRFRQPMSAQGGASAR